MIWILFGAVFVLGMAIRTRSIFASEEVAIWPGEAPGSEGRADEETVVNERVRNVHQPSLTVHLPPRELATGTAVLVCPGGGYHHLAIYKEGHQVAAWLNTLGVAAFVLKYRLDRGEALADAKEAIKLIRRKSEAWGIRRDRVGAMGFSAGGHLVVNLMLTSEADTRPDFLVPIYVSIKTLDLEHTTSENALPAFIAGASDDTTTTPVQAIALYQKLLLYGVPLELHLYESGGHGFGLAKTKGATASWTVRCEDWMRGRGLLDVASTGK
ncbi:MAG: alpha/beta hydrolase [bacterium]|nr:alpha/beta hydrolase [bacterium]